MYDLKIPAAFIVVKCPDCGVNHAPIRTCEESSASQELQAL